MVFQCTQSTKMHDSSRQMAGKRLTDSDSDIPPGFWQRREELLRREYKLCLICFTGTFASEDIDIHSAMHLADLFTQHFDSRYC
jgi:hypothetical protein